MNHRIYILFSLLFCSMTLQAQILSQPTLKLLEQLDQEIEKMPAYEQAKRQRISALKEAATNASSLDYQIWYNTKLYEEYFVFDVDSAKQYLSANINLYQKTDNQEKLVDCLMALCEVYINTGLFDEATMLLNSAKPIMNSSQKVNYYALYQLLYERMVRYYGNNEAVKREKAYQESMAYQDSVMQTLTPEHPQYLWMKYVNAIYRQNEKEVDETLEALKKACSGFKLETRQEAMLEYGLAHLYLLKKQDDPYVYHMICAAIADIRCSNHDMGSLNELSGYFYNQKDYEHAFKFINLGLQVNASFGDRVRLNEQGKLMQQISTKLSEERTLQRERILYLLIGATILSILLLGAVIYIVRLYRSLERNQKKLAENNSELEKNIEALKQSNEQQEEANRMLLQTQHKLELLQIQLKRSNISLQESNEIKQAYIVQILNICSTYIHKMDKFRVDINRKVKTKQYNDIEEFTNSQVMTQAQLREFNKTFDAVFLSIYPNFVDDFNQLMDPSYQLLPMKGEQLSTELRILALIKLGVTDGVKIADFLHCSSQTVYNYRQRISSHSNISDKKELITAIQAL